MAGQTISVTFPDVPNEQNRPMIWFGSWLVGEEGTEGEWFYSSRGGAVVQTSRPARATGIRIRRWPNDGFDAEYADVLEIEGLTRLDVDSLDFDIRQEHSLLAEDFGLF